MDQQLKRLILDRKKSNYTCTAEANQKRYNTYSQVASEVSEEVGCKYTESDVRFVIQEEILRLRKCTAYSNAEIAREIGCDYHTVYNCLKENDLIKKRNRQTPAEIQERNTLILESKKKRYSNDQIRSIINQDISNDTITRVLKDMGYNPEEITETETKALELKARGKKSAEITRELGISQKALRSLIYRHADQYNNYKKIWEEEMNLQHASWVVESDLMTPSVKSDEIKKRIINSCSGRSDYTRREIIIILGISSTYYDRIRKQYLDQLM